MRKLYYSLTIILCLFIYVSCSTESTPVYTLSTSASPTEAGSVSPSNGEYDEGEEVQITASPNEHWVFDGWEGDASGSNNPTTVVVNANKDIAAVFIKREYPLTVETEGDGTVSERVIQAKTTDYPHGTTVELTANPADGWDFVEWQGDIAGSDNPVTITVDDAKEVTAIFQKITHDVIFEREGEGWFTINLLSGNKVDEHKFEHGSKIELNAFTNGDDLWEFIRWEGDLESTSYKDTLIVDRDLSITVTFKEGVYDIEGDFYESVKIGEQIWISENLRTTKYSNGDAIPNISSYNEWVDLSIGAWMNYDNDEEIAEIYGRLYNWHTMVDDRNICPQGWRVSTDSDWIELIDYLADENGDTDNVGGLLKAQGTDYWTQPNEGATNASAFTGLPGGFVADNSYQLRSNGYWGTPNEIGDQNQFISWGLTHNESAVYWYYSDKTVGVSVRCIFIDGQSTMKQSIKEGERILGNGRSIP